MTTVTIYHNPRCSKSRQSLAIVEQLSDDIEIIEYLKTPPTAATIGSLLTMLDINARALMRTKESEYKEQSLAEVTDEEQLIQAMVNTPKLIERPIVVVNNKAVIGRPPEQVQALLEQEL
ncbi:arsenate reductase (glutaredoxin) [Paraferrimonas haliotis]|uniref:Arsenate reductase n=1 Tax=Paraferrimonas haliotis TaxID=2013866 RepID=A0AA37WZX9_9GAMM|nr:arsenate reductase (glutaredoxin) [Paraferrimonas haliotis]GLS84276.1 arsenate reductase [Paraferrimonas haliotis]